MSPDSTVVSIWRLTPCQESICKEELRIYKNDVVDLFVMVRSLFFFVCFVTFEVPVFEVTLGKSDLQ